jgi:hypothetical protein
MYFFRFLTEVRLEIYLKVLIHSEFIVTSVLQLRLADQRGIHISEFLPKELYINSYHMRMTRNIRRSQTLLLISRVHHVN